MRGTFSCVFVLGGLAILSVAQDLPLCASDCLATRLEDSPCDAADFECICSDQTLMGNVESCSVESCSVVEGLGKFNPKPADCSEMRTTSITNCTAAGNGTAILCNEPIRDRSLHGWEKHRAT